MKLLVVIVSYRVTDLTIDCLRSLGPEVERMPGVKVALCENGTGGDAADRLQRTIDENNWSTWVELIVVYPNRGFTGGNNVVIRPALESSDPPEYVLLLNADTIVRERSLDPLLTFMDDHPHVGIAGSMLIGPDGTIESTPFRFPGIATEFERGLRLGIVSKLFSRCNIALPKREGSFRAGWVSGACMMLRRSMLEQIGLLDEGLYTYCDDSDICLRAQRAGWETWYVPASQITHLGGASTGVSSQRAQSRRPSYWYEARRRYFVKNHGALYTAFADAAFISAFALWRLRRWIQGKPDTDPPHTLADSIRHSVFCTGLKVNTVENPALRETLVRS